MAAFAALAVLLTISVAATVWLAERGKPKPWTAFPIAANDDPVKRAEEVAALVQGRYLDDAGKPLGTISAGEDLIPDVPGGDQIVAVDSTSTGPPLSFEYGNIVFFTICGTGPSCAFQTPKGSSPERVVAIHAREAKELALRGLRNVPEADSAMIVMPAGILQPDTEGGPVPIVVSYYRRAELRDQLDNPLPPEFEAPEPTPTDITDDTAKVMLTNYAPSLYRLDQPKPTADGTGIIYRLVPSV